MSCMSPIRIKKDSPQFYKNFWKNHIEKDSGDYIYVPCGKCEECLKRKQNEWIARLMIENMYSESAFFVTLTYDTPHLPLPYGVMRSDIQKFMKRLRKAHKCRVFGVSEYGGVHGRPHYHLCLFFDVPLSIVQMSHILSDTWKLGNHNIGYVDVSSISYCAKYCLKPRKDPLGLYWNKTFAFMSRNPGIGVGFFMEDISDFINNDCFEFSVLGQRKFAMPRYFRDKVFDDDAKERHFFEMQEKYGQHNQDIFEKNEVAYKRAVFEQKQKDF